MAGDNALDGETDAMAQDDGAIDGAIDELRGVLKKNAGQEPDLSNESVDGMGGAAAFGTDFGADFADGDAAADDNDPFNIGDPADMSMPGLGDTAFGGDFGGDAAMGQDFGAAANAPPEVKTGASGAASHMDLVLGIPIDVQIILGSSRMAVSSLMNLSEGATIALDRKIGEPVEIMVNGKLIGRGEITVLDSDETRFAVRIIEVIGEERKKSS
ncbi:MAG: flagellar motor switch protein FliN [Hoeflea sp.]|uniref:flagellar motor switch protein FliN n=1 Tax=Hoeflea sp. TaxID=1940281 RepID=UPI001D41E892|nr:flagellar motor switch protein FliN [Hoeflea sp.]MBU4531136.1 flagellar motor switch protein FliN [Alphaproteobacteria bacterium]MBU4545802.1 flagellar motor switch protein FliN [Alphaproteobacteria bacterium]MBU4550771.1 flagellar motor switch protein FliN [Alphaproteobacteria bacterium]MBV1724413.1 flagellar motor switch protein FliN [Hoeflea sp.]MBV1760433.1 flagellar motor switch protein FliN [Hoeflea sp.]